MKSNNLPLVEAIQQHIRNHPVSFHVPGHKNGTVFHHAIHANFQSVLPYDVTELSGLDDLHAPTGAILEAQQAAARLYQAKETFFLVGGSTVGNLAMIYGMFDRGDQVFVQRNSHKSIFHALQIAGLTAILLTPEFDEESGLAVGVARQTLQKALNLYPNAKGLIITYPNYFGVSLDVEPIIKLAKKHHVRVLVDEAHAAHFCLGQPFPPSTLQLGADVVVQSAHKMLPALTMSSFLHISHKLNDDYRHRIKEALAMFQSSSPSYLLMASLDGARAYAESLSTTELTTILAGVQAVKTELSSIKQIKILNWDDRYLSDPLKVTIKTTTNLTGFELQELFNKNNIYTELADDKHVLLVFGLGQNSLDKEVVKSIKQSLGGYEVRSEELSKKAHKVEMDIKQLEFNLSEVRELPKRRIPLTMAEGFVAAEAIIPYPPGVPIILQGERIDKKTLVEVNKLLEAGATFQVEQQLEDVLVIDSEDENE
ncbi:aminotransferase class I/II-fold pyridoxal phosphate-dependent enzyme [Halalkalibacter kiskunsagensis]|uniref:Aminotransferase class I/II-fold pyridoxal phosphate-dependent enzyme n=1 Tax=Halalkalibacter kiskunsagensis TaxID=1548599 RepID=A0ABV6KLK6_9BACI